MTWYTRWLPAAVLLLVVLVSVACDDNSANTDPEQSAVAGTWVQQEGSLTHTLEFDDYPCRFATTDGAGDTLSGFRGVYDIDSSVSPTKIDFTVSYVYGRDNVYYEPLFGRIEVNGDSMRIAFPDSVGALDRAPLTDPGRPSWYTLYEMVRTAD